VVPLIHALKLSIVVVRDRDDPYAREQAIAVLKQSLSLPFSYGNTLKWLKLLFYEVRATKAASNRSVNPKAYKSTVEVARAFVAAPLALLPSALWPPTLDSIIKEAREALGMKPKTALSKWTCKSFDVATWLPETLL
jgi:hypothetical protein